MLLAVWLVGPAFLSCGCESETGSPSAASSAAGAPAPDPLWFRDVTDEVGLDFIHDAGPVGSYFMPQSIGSGVALLDVDGDGRLDIYLLQNAGPDSASTNRLYRQRSDGRFEDVSAGSGLDVSGYGMGVAVGDVDNDGRPDVLVTEYGRLRLFRNEGAAKFVELGAAAGVTSPLWATSTSFLDYDRDGWLDLVVANYVNYDPARWCARPGGKREFCGPDAFPGVIAKLFRNLGARAPSGSGGIRFEDVTVESGLAETPGPGLGVVCLDFDGDHWIDIFVANDGAANHLWINQRDGTFVEDAMARGIAFNTMGRTEANMGIAVGDVDGDRLFEVFVTHLTDETPTLWKQGPRGMFDDRTATAGLSGVSWRGTGFGTIMGDFDNDGALDIAAVNGRVRLGTTPPPAGVPRYPELAAFWDGYAQRDQLFRNDGSGRYRDVSPANAPFCGWRGVSRGVACGDLDGDGGVDLVVTAIGGRARVFRNVTQGRGHWLRVRPVESGSGRVAHGAEVALHIGEAHQWRWINPGHSFLSSSDPRAHFGLGEVDHVDAIDVRWLDGSREFFPGGPVDREVLVERGRGRKVAQ